ncbi:MAG TPA: glycoside hydrolase family 3 N-terminal domain-containing protein [Thermoanaerobaculia bacterium]|nr:glycoside hydrolase family 3 N-terminal domain-containing protein [Thermoanaerobaculia bacterium]
MTALLFGVGIGGPAISSAERGILRRQPPWAVILFRRNIETADQLAALVEDLKTLPGPPVICLDQEGGPVDRLKELLGPAISFAAASRAGQARRAGELAGESCRAFGFDVDLAPVVDRGLPEAGALVLGERCAAAEPERIERAAREFLEGLHAGGVGGCLKHFPGLGRARLDTHKSLPKLEPNPEEERLDIAPFAALMDAAGAVMISHAASPAGRPASLSRDVGTNLLRKRLGFQGAAFSDDLEMGALSDFGDLPARSAAACLAGCDLLFVCKQIEAYPDCVEGVLKEVPPRRRAEAALRLQTYRRHLEEMQALAPPAARPIAQLVTDIAELRALGT